MSEQERLELLEEKDYIQLLLDFHVRNKERIAMNTADFEEYVNAVLDRLNEIDNLLNTKENDTEDR
jgi:ribosome assembly protein YihI (activator of Der GTPase)